MAQIHLSRSSQLDMTAPALPTINIAEGRSPGQQRPLTMTLVFNDENKCSLARSAVGSLTHTPRSCLHSLNKHSHTLRVCV